MSTRLAVLPLADSSADSSQEYLGVGIADELLYTLAWAEGIQGKPLTSSMRFTGPDLDLKAAAEQLKVEALLVGSARYEGDQVVVSTRLLRMPAEEELWSQDYQRPRAELGEVMDDILKHVVPALGAHELEPGKLSVRKGWTDNVEAYDLYLQGLNYFRRYAMENNRKALEKFGAALKLDQRFAKAWARLAECYIKYYMYHDAGNAEHVERADKASARAVELAPEFARTHTARGIAHLMKQEFREAEVEFEKAEELLPRQFDAWFWHARCCFQQGRLKKAIELFEQAEKVQPDDYQTPLLMRQACLSLGRTEGADEAARRGLELAQAHLKLNRKDARAIYLACGAMVQLGMYDQAMQWADKALAINPDDPMINYNVACCFAQAGEKERALDCLDKARNSGMVSVGWVKNDADLVSLHGEERFQKLLEELER